MNHIGIPQARELFIRVPGQLPLFFQDLPGSHYGRAHRRSPLFEYVADCLAQGQQPQQQQIDEEQKVSAAIGYIENAYAYAWALAFDYADKSQCARFWYVSEIKSARREAAQRLQTIEQHIEQGKQILQKTPVWGTTLLWRSHPKA